MGEAARCCRPMRESAPSSGSGPSAACTSRAPACGRLQPTGTGQTGGSIDRCELRPTRGVMNRRLRRSTLLGLQARARSNTGPAWPRTMRACGWGAARPRCWAQAPGSSARLLQQPLTGASGSSQPTDRPQALSSNTRAGSGPTQRLRPRCPSHWARRSSGGNSRLISSFCKGPCPLAVKHQLVAGAVLAVQHQLIQA